MIYPFGTSGTDPSYDPLISVESKTLDINYFSADELEYDKEYYREQILKQLL